MSVYLKISVNGVTHLLHRYVWEQAHGPIPDGMIVHHVNHVKHDNRLDNLQLMTHEEHARHHNDKHAREKTCAVCGEVYAPPAKHRARSRTCSPQCFRVLMSQQRTASNGQRKLSADQVAAIRRRIGAGERKCDLANEYGVSRATMTRLVPPSREAMG